MNLEKTIGRESFEKTKINSKLDLILDDIEVATKQLSNLRDEEKPLLEAHEDAIFRINELNVEKENLKLSINNTSLAHPNDIDSENGKSNLSDEGQFFGFLNSIENREIEINARIEAGKQIKSELGHKLSILRQENQKLKSELDLSEEALNNEETSFRNDDDYKKDFQIALDLKITENENIIQQCEDLKEELEIRNKELTSGVFEEYQGLKKQLDTKQKELQFTRDKADKMKKEVKTLENLLHKDLQKEEERFQEQSSVSQWRTDRSLLKNKLKTLKTQLLNEQKNLDKCQKRDDGLSERYQKLLDSEQHNLGNCEKARKCLLAQINESQFKTRIPTSTEIEYENEYTEELLKEKDKIEKSKNIFEQYKDAALSELNIEYNGCSQNGYIKLLRDELNQLQNELSKLV